MQQTYETQATQELKRKARSNVFFIKFKKKLQFCIAINMKLSQSYGASPAIWDHSVTCHPTVERAPP